MPTQTLTAQAPRPVELGATERIDAIACLDERNRSRASEPQQAAPGRYLEVQGAGETLLVPVGRDVIHVGRGLSADLHLDEGSVSRRHAILVRRGRAQDPRRSQRQRHARQRPSRYPGGPEQRRCDRARPGRSALPGAVVPTSAVYSLQRRSRGCHPGHRRSDALSADGPSSVVVAAGSVCARPQSFCGSSASRPRSAAGSPPILRAAAQPRDLPA